MTQMEAILKGFPNVMDFDQFKANSKNLDRIKVSLKSHLKILHQLTTSCFQFMIKCSQIDQNVCDWCQLLHFFQLFGFLMEKSFPRDFEHKNLEYEICIFFYASHCKVRKQENIPAKSQSIQQTQSIQSKQSVILYGLINISIQSRRFFHQVHSI